MLIHATIDLLFTYWITCFGSLEILMSRCGPISDSLKVYIWYHLNQLLWLFTILHGLCQLATGENKKKCQSQSSTNLPIKMVKSLISLFIRLHWNSGTLENYNNFQFWSALKFQMSIVLCNLSTVNLQRHVYSTKTRKRCPLLKSCRG